MWTGNRTELRDEWLIAPDGILLTLGELPITISAARTLLGSSVASALPCELQTAMFRR
jgi:hypothetical protein